MKLQEKILYCRKKLGLSQEELAEQIGVSRQAISKWETGDAVPEVSKLMLLGKTFGVTTDWLLSEEEPKEEKTEEYNTGASPNNTSWIDSLPGVVGKCFRKYGWILGIYVALVGLGFTVVGGLARFITRKMFNFGDDMFGNGGITFDEFGQSFSSFAINNPVTIMGTVILIIGIVLMIAGVTLVVVLKRHSKV